MARYTVFINGQRYRISMSDVSDYYYQDKSPIEDIIHYEVELDEGDWNGTIRAWIENPSQHTLYLIENGLCSITINCRNFMTHSGEGCHQFGQWDPDDPRKIHPEWYNMSHSSGLGRGSYRFHKHWSLCFGTDSLVNNDDRPPVAVTDPNDIVIPFRFQTANRWQTRNVKGYSCVQHSSDRFKNPYRTQYYFDIRLALLTGNPWNVAGLRVYQTESKITRITFDY